MKNTMLNEVES